MTLGRAAGLSIAVLMVLVGAVWTGQGLGWIGGSSMSGSSTWAVVGPIVAGLGVALIIVIVGRIRRGPDQQGPPGRYGRQGESQRGLRGFRHGRFRPRKRGRTA